MYPIPGHLGMSLAGCYITRLPIIPSIIATFSADVIDKVLKDILDIAPYGRCWMHTLLAVAVCTAIVWWWKGAKWGLSWMIGHLLHLIGDIGFIPWFYPFIDYQWPDAPNVTKAAVKGIQETMDGFKVVKDATGTIQMKGFQFSEAVTNVFKPKLILFEGMIMASSCILLYKRDFLEWRWKTLLLALLLSATVFRLFYDFPEVIGWLSLYLGDWVHIS